uniref:Uncharacterized protein n=1 Tax=Romanomermis culicivorax TaxID=13658 RepID=A0A915L354_ROMCU
NPASGRRIPCSGFYFDGDSSKCTFLASSNWLATSATIATRSETFYFEKFCLKFQDKRKCGTTFNRHTQKVLIGFAAETSNTGSIFECVEKCYNSWIYYGFDCYSILYYYEK